MSDSVRTVAVISGHSSGAVGTPPSTSGEGTHGSILSSTSASFCSTCPHVDAHQPAVAPTRVLSYVPLSERRTHHAFQVDNAGYSSQAPARVHLLAVAVLLSLAGG